MYDRSTSQRQGSYSYPPLAANSSPPRAYSSSSHTSSAFSANANPNEDWTKISDLAERRRIQNRIAQRNYRKKLKKRLEDLERRAGSSSASPEQKHEELPETDSVSSARHGSVSEVRCDGSPEMFPPQYVLPSSDDRGMFSQQFTRQLSTSPPPFSYGSFSSIDSAEYGTSTSPPAANPVTYCGIVGGVGAIDVPMYPHYASSLASPYQPMVPSMPTPPIKQEFYSGDDDMNPFSMSYATIAGVDVLVPGAHHAHSYSDVAAYTPPLSDCLDFSDSPPESMGYPRTPPMFTYDPFPTTETW